MLTVTPGVIQGAYQAEWEKPLERPLLPEEQPSPDHNPLAQTAGTERPEVLGGRD